MAITLPKELVPPLLLWYDREGRRLPWREYPTPYRVLVSEIMLQQTRVEAVKPYFARFIRELPDIAALAACPEDKLHKLWEGLGYYSRVRNLQRAAVAVMRDHGGVLPRKYDTLLTLPGIGPYTAGAVSAFAYGEKEAAVDGNVLRVIARLTGDERSISDPRLRSEYAALVKSVLPDDRPGDVGQALIELGAVVCLPNTAPACEKCPLAPLCLARKDGKTDTLPRKDAKKPRKVQPLAVLLLRDGAHTLIRKRPKTGLLASLYEFPNLAGNPATEEILAYARSLGLDPLTCREVGKAKHLFTHIEWDMTVYDLSLADDALPRNIPLAARNGGLVPDPDGEYVFADTDTLRDTYAVPSAFAFSLNRLGGEKGSARIRKTSLSFSGFSVEYHDTLPSTSALAKEKARAGCPSGTVIAAREQTAGHGRFDRPFDSPAGAGLYFSCVFRKPLSGDDLPLVTPAVAAAVSRVLEEKTATPVGIKWVNDLILAGKKVCGILTEGIFDPDGTLSAIVIGIGINLKKRAFPPHLSSVATSVEEATGVAISADELLAALLPALDRALDSPGQRAFLPAYRERSVLTGKRVTVSRGDETFSATVTGIGDSCELLLNRDGAPLSLTSGEVTKIHPDTEA